MRMMLHQERENVDKQWELELDAAMSKFEQDIALER